MMKELSKQLKVCDPDDPSFLDKRQVYQNMLGQKDILKQKKKAAKAQVKQQKEILSQQQQQMQE